jgi:hypothetical protein
MLCYHWVLWSVWQGYDIRVYTEARFYRLWHIRRSKQDFLGWGEDTNCIKPSVPQLTNGEPFPGMYATLSVRFKLSKITGQRRNYINFKFKHEYLFDGLYQHITHWAGHVNIWYYPASGFISLFLRGPYSNHYLLVVTHFYRSRLSSQTAKQWQSAAAQMCWRICFWRRRKR